VRSDGVLVAAAHYFLLRDEASGGGLARPWRHGKQESTGLVPRPGAWILRRTRTQPLRAGL